MKSFFNRRGVLRTLVLSLALGALGISASAMAATGGLRVTITEPDGTPITGVRVTASAPTSLVTRTGVSSDDGTVILRGLIPGTDYEVELEAAGYPDFTAQNVAVVSDKQFDLHYILRSADTAELGVVTVTGQSLAVIDTTSSSLGTVLTLDIVESLPTGRSYQSYLQLVPAVKPSQTGNPASRSGVNYANIGGDTGSSSDNLYILDGINVTDPETGTFGSGINSEIIKEQVVLTGGIPAKYSGGTGLVTSVVTKSGSNEFHGSVNYYFQNDSLVADSEHNTIAGFSSYDTAFTLGGPIIEDELWFYLSYQKKYDETDVLNAATGESLRTVNTDTRFAFLKTTWQITNRDRLQATFFNDPSTISGSEDPTRLANRDFTQEEGSENFKLSYSHQGDSFSLEAYAYKHRGEVTTTPKDFSVRNDVVYLGGNPTLAERQRGGLGVIDYEYSERKQYGLNGEYWLNTDWGTHDIQFGVAFTDVASGTETSIPPGGMSYSSLAAQDAGITLETYANGSGFIGERDITSGAFTPILNAIAASPNNAYFVGLLDTSGDGTVSQTELEAYQFTSTAGNPNGQVNVYRLVLAQQNPSEIATEGTAFYLQDSWTNGQWTANVGFRTEQWVHFASTGQEIFTFDWEIAPRLSVVYDLFGDGTSKVWAFYGRYYDPIRHNMTNFAGDITGNLTYEQIYLGNQFLTYRVRGGIGQLDAVFAPSTQTPYTDELLLGYAATLAPNMGLEVVLDYRKTSAILEDYNEHLYSIDEGDGLPPNSPYYLPPAYFGYPNGFPDGVNFFIGTLAGGERTYTGLTATLTKYRSDNWMGSVSYTYNHFEGNTSSDSNADFQGDLVRLDPRAPNRYGEMPGNIDHQFQAYGAYYFDSGLEIGGLFQWNSGVAYSKTLAILGRHIPAWSATETFDFGGPGNPYVLPVIEPGTVGAFEAPAYWTLDLRVKYTMDLSVGQAEFFLDIFNALNNQDPIREMDVRGGLDPYAFGEANDWLKPRQFYLGVRYSF